jgi:hypothetical protein
LALSITGDLKGPGIALAVLGMILAYVIGFAPNMELIIKEWLLVALFSSIAATLIVECLHRRDRFEARLVAVETRLAKLNDPKFD